MCLDLVSKKRMCVGSLLRNSCDCEAVFFSLAKMHCLVWMALFLGGLSELAARVVLFIGSGVGVGARCCCCG